MPRTLTTAFKNALVAERLSPRFFIELELAAATIRYWTGGYDVTVDSKVWQGNGYLNEIGEVTLTRRIENQGLEIQIAGELEVLVSLAMQSVQQNKAAYIYLGFLDSNGAVISNLSPYFIGIFDNAEIEDNPDSAKITLRFQNLLVENDADNELRYTHQTQIALFSGDLGFEYVEQLEDFRGYWGKQTTDSGKKPGKGGGGAKGQGKGQGGRPGKKKKKKRERAGSRRG
jgi:hypothetical protein